MPYNSVADSIHTKRLCIKLCSRKLHFWRKDGHFAFLEAYRQPHAVHFKLIGKRVVSLDFLLVITELGVTAEALRADIDWKSAFV